LVRVIVAAPWPIGFPINKPTLLLILPTGA